MSPRTRHALNGSMRVLVVDDEETFRFVMENRLRGSGHFVESAANAETALERIAERAFDVMLLDLRMPGVGGLGALRRLSETGLPCEVVVLTGQPDYDDCVAAMKLGAFHYLRKPMEPALIEETLWRAVEHGGLRRENAALRRMLAPASPSEFVGESPAIRAVLELAQKAEERERQTPSGPPKLTESDQQVAERLLARLRRIILEETHERDPDKPDTE